MSNNQTSTLNSSIENLHNLLQLFTGRGNSTPDTVCPYRYQSFFEYMYNQQTKQGKHGESSMEESQEDDEIIAGNNGNNLTNKRTETNLRIRINKIQEILDDLKNREQIFEKEKEEELINEGNKRDREHLKVKFSDGNISFREDMINHAYKKPNQKKFRCEEENCGKSFFKRSHLLDHQKLHTPPNFKCPHKNCPSSFSFIENLDKHIEMHDKKPYMCPAPACRKSFSSLFNYQVIFNNLFF